MAVQSEWYQATVGSKALKALTDRMPPKEKSDYLWRYTNWPKPTIGRDGVIEVPDPNGTTHHVGSEVLSFTYDTRYSCRDCDDGTCFAPFHAERTAELYGGDEYERNTGASIHTLRPSTQD